MVYAAIVLAMLVGAASGAAVVWWRLRPPPPAKSRSTQEKSGSTRSADEEIRKYQMAINAMSKFIDADRYDEAFTIARNWCNRAPHFAESWRHLRGEFVLKEMPPIEYAAQHLVALRDVGELRRLREVLMPCEDLKPWQNLLAEEIVAASELSRIFDLVERNPGITQETAARRVDAGIRRAFKSLHDADLRDLIRRERDGRGYALYLE